MIDRFEKAPQAARALLEAAMDFRRMGHPEMLPLGLLADTAPSYLTPRVQEQLDDAWLPKALAYCVKDRHGVRAPLSPMYPRRGQQWRRPSDHPAGYRLADFLEQHGRTLLRTSFPRAGFWLAALTHLQDRGRLMTLADAARERGRLRIAVELIERAMALPPRPARKPEDDPVWAGIDDDVLASLEIRDMLRAGLETTTPSTSGEVLRQMRAEDPAWNGALALVDSAHFATPDVLPDQDHPAFEEDLAVHQYAWDAREACVALAAARERAEDMDTAVRLYRVAADAGDGLALGQVARLRERQHGTDAAMDTYREAAELQDDFAVLRLAALGRAAGHSPHKLIARVRARFGRQATAFALVLEEAGLHEDAEAVVTSDVEEDRRGWTALLLAMVAAAEGRTETARRRYLVLADRSDFVGMTAQARLHELQHEWDAAEALYRQAEAAWPPLNAVWSFWPLLRVSESPRHHVLEPRPTLWDQVRMRERAGACDHAWELVVAAANAGDATTLWRLAGDRVRRGRSTENAFQAREAHKVLRYGIDSDGHATSPWDTERHLDGAAPWWVGPC